MARAILSSDCLLWGANTPLTPRVVENEGDQPDSATGALVQLGALSGWLLAVVSMACFDAGSFSVGMGTLFGITASRP